MTELAEGGGLENHCTVYLYRGFESPSLRHFFCRVLTNFVYFVGNLTSCYKKNYTNIENLGIINK